MNVNQAFSMLANSASTTSGQSNNEQQQHSHQLGDAQQDSRLAIANLFNSLTNLAAGGSNMNNHQQQQQRHHYHEQMSSSLSSQHKQIVQPNGGNFSSNHQQPLAANSSSSPPTSRANQHQMAITSSIQSVLAAAMMQQQQQQQQHHSQPMASVSSGGALPSQVAPPAPTQMPPTSVTFDPSQQLGLFGHQPAQLDLSNFGLNAQSNQQQQQQQQQQRINYCTICNKELCNKYFMKTHMLKMHGINLEMEQADNGNNAADNEQADKSGESTQDDLDEQQQNEQPSSELPKDTTNKSVVGGGKQQASNKKSNGKQTTSVMNGFAGNSMGGVVCDICNKELCSKYFLKVHKQNTHGIMTDYQDVASQFMYPFGAASNPFMPAPAPAAAASLLPQPQQAPEASQLPMGAPNPLAFFTGGRQQQPASGTDATLAGVKRTGANKRMRTARDQRAQDNIDKQAAASSYFANMTAPSGSPAQDQQLGSVYRLLIAQQQQQHQQHQLPPQMAPFGAEQLGALMCFGAMGAANPFGAPAAAAAMSPAMIVDNILRNQHLFNRNQMTQQQPKMTTPDKNNNNNEAKNKKGNSASGSNSKTEASSSSKYFSHYTEACPMCDRRFKSIKWLKTHMMNDHKQEIGAYMQMMLQYMYTSKSQQMAAAAAIAAIEQQQQNHLQLHQHEQAHHAIHLGPPPPPPPVSLAGLGSPFNRPSQHQVHIPQPQPLSTQMTSEALVELIRRQQKQVTNLSHLSPQQQQQQCNQRIQQQQQCEAQDFSLDSRKDNTNGSASIHSDDGSVSMIRHSPISPGSQLDSLGLSFEQLSRLSNKRPIDNLVDEEEGLESDEDEQTNDGQEADQDDDDDGGGAQHGTRVAQAPMQIKSSGD